MTAMLPEDPMLPAACRVMQVTRETPDTFTLQLECVEGDGPGGFAPGQFSMLYVFGVGEVPVSISGDPEQSGRLTYTVRSVGQVTHALVCRRPGDTVGVRGPFGTAWPLSEARGLDVLVVAGGIGLAPLRPAIYHVLRNRDEFGRLILLYGARSPRDLLYRKELAGWARRSETQVLLTVDYAGLDWRGRVGVVTTLFRYARLRPEQTLALVCGPEIMMRFVAGELLSRGVPASKIYVSMERNMKCAIGWCGHCQYGPFFVCKDGPVFPYEKVRALWRHDEL
jgi:NAD(P)H-flavin reductase